jgi:uncharacterized FlaG/YvyC family protein
LNAKSHHHPQQKSGLIKTLFSRADRICDPINLKKEHKKLYQALRMNGYTIGNIYKARRPKNRLETQDSKEEQRFVTLPYVAGTTEKIGRILKKLNVRVAFKPHSKIQDTHRSVKDPVHLASEGVYKIPCDSGKIYIGETGRSVSCRIKEHERYLRLDQPEKSTIAEHAIKENHHIDFNNTKILARTHGYTQRLVRKALEILKHPYNVNRDSGYNLSKTWSILFTSKRTKMFTSSPI